MALRRGPKKKGSKRRLGKPSGLAILFWLAFAIFLFGFFLYNREAIGDGVRTIQSVFIGGGDPETPPPVSPEPAPVQGAPVQVIPVQPAEPLAQLPPQTEQPERVPDPGPPEMRDRALYFTQVDRSGDILRVRVDRRLPASPSPLTDVLNALVAGPNEEERQRGLVSLIPPGSQVISIRIDGATAVINFNENFQFNTFGVEGYAAQVIEVVFTTTEFPNINNVQILIEGRRIDFLGEGIWIGGSLSREMF